MGTVIETRNEEAGFVEFINSDRPVVVSEISGSVAILRDLDSREIIGYRVYDPAPVAAGGDEVGLSASDHACYLYPDENQGAERAAFVEGAICGASDRITADKAEIARLRAERDGLRKAVKTIAFMRPLGPSRNKTVEIMERVAIDALGGSAALEAQERTA